MVRRPADDYDTGWKEMARKYFRPLLEFFFPVVAGHIDWEHDVEFLDKELKQAVRLGGRGGRTVDLLAKVWLRNGERACVLVHLEVQSQVDRTLPKRMYEYRSLIHAREQLRVESLCILADPDPGWRPDRYEDKGFVSELVLKFGVVKLLDYRARWEELQRDPSPFALVVMAHLKSLETKGSPDRRLRMKTELMALMYERGYSEDEFLDLARFLDLVMPLPRPLQLQWIQEVKTFEEEKTMAVMSQWEKYTREQGIEQGIEQGAVQTAREMVLDALQERYPDTPTALRSRLSELADAGELRSLFKVILRANSVQDIERHMPAPSR
jgi:hypothetical protein